MDHLEGIDLVAFARAVSAIAAIASAELGPPVMRMQRAAG